MKKYAFDSSVLVPVASSPTISLKLNQTQSIVPINLESDATINLDEDSRPNPGDRAVIKASSDATARNLTFGTGFIAPVLAGVINKTKVQEFVYDGSAFIAVAAPVQID